MNGLNSVFKIYLLLFLKETDNLLKTYIKRKVTEFGTVKTTMNV